MTSAQSDDFALLQAWRNGDMGAGQALVRHHTPTLHRFFASKAPNALEDLIQATFLACVEVQAQFRGSSTFRTYLLGIARNLLLKHYRKQLRGQRALALERVCADQVSGSVSLSAAVRQEVRLLLGGLRRIPIDQQIAVELFYWEGLGIAEIAEVLDVAEGTIKSRLARARAQLKHVILSGAESPALQRSTAEELERWAGELRGLPPYDSRNTS
jgi:RNA polymerase sigma-70 factor (ECF subfamily)